MCCKLMQTLILFDFLHWDVSQKSCEIWRILIVELLIYITNHLNLTLNYRVNVASCCKHWLYLSCYIEMFCIILLKSKDLMTSNKFMLTNTRCLIYNSFHYKLMKQNSIFYFFEIRNILHRKNTHWYIECHPGDKRIVLVFYWWHMNINFLKFL